MDIPSKVIITGISGFTGVYLRKFLEDRGFNVFGISAHPDPDRQIYQCDITNKDEVRKTIALIAPQYIIHLAAISFVGHQNNLQMYEVNVLGAENILEACLGIPKPVRIIMASSATVYGNQNTDQLHERLCANPVNHYGISKFAMEQMARNYFTRLPIVITRPFNYTAPGQDINFIIPKIADAFRNRQGIIELGNTHTYREYNSIGFVCEAYYRLLLSGEVSEIYNVCSGSTYSLNEIMDIFSELTGHKMQVVTNEKFVRANEILRLAGDPSKLSAVAGNISGNDIREIVTSFI